MIAKCYFPSALVSVFSALALAVAHADSGVDVPLIKEAPVAPDFTAALWSKAATIAHLHKMGSSLAVMGLEVKEEASPLTKVHLLRDHEALYIGVECFDPEIGKMDKGSATLEGVWLDGDCIEIYLDGDLGPSQAYYHIGYNASGARVEQHAREAVKPGEWTVVSRVDADAWRSLVRIPYALLGVSADTDAIRGIIFRNYHPHRRSEGASTRSTWGGGALHNPSDFQEIRFSEEAAP